MKDSKVFADFLSRATTQPINFYLHHFWKTSTRKKTDEE